MFGYIEQRPGRLLSKPRAVNSVVFFSRQHTPMLALQREDWRDHFYVIYRHAVVWALLSFSRRGCAQPSRFSSWWHHLEGKKINRKLTCCHRSHKKIRSMRARECKGTLSVFCFCMSSWFVVYSKLSLKFEVRRPACDTWLLSETRVHELEQYMRLSP